MSFIFWSKIKPFIEIILLWLVYYRMLVFFEGTRAFHVLKGILYLVLIFLASQLLGLSTLNWMLTKLFGLSLIALMIIFQQELRQGLARLGQQHFFNFALKESDIDDIIEQITDAVYKMSRNKIGALIAVERDTKLKTYIESGISLDAKVSSELIQSIFINSSPLHDGGIIARGNRIVAASCLFPLSENPNFSKIIGTRHRAALGLTEHTDSIVVLVSEETGDISLTADGRFIPITTRERLTHILKSLLMASGKKKK